MSGMYDDADEALAAEPSEEAEPTEEAGSVEDAEPTEEADATEGADDGEVTGHPAVDAVLASLEGLEKSPVGEHVPVFESAHDALRRALNDAGEG